MAQRSATYFARMTYVLSLRHRVHDFDRWKTVFDQRLDARLQGKVTGHRLTRSLVDPSEVEVVMEFASQAHAESYLDYMSQPETRAALVKAGVVEHAPMWIGMVVDVASY